MYAIRSYYGFERRRSGADKGKGSAVEHLVGVEADLKSGGVAVELLDAVTVHGRNGQELGAVQLGSDFAVDGHQGLDLRATAAGQKSYNFV